MKTGLLTILAVAISTVLTAGSPHASDTSTPEAAAAATAAAETAATEAGAIPVAAAPEPLAAELEIAAEGEGVDSGDVEAAPLAATAAGADADVEAAAAIAPSEAAEALEVETDAAVASNDESASSGARSEIETLATPAASDAENASESAEAARKVTLGEIGYDEQGRSGRIHLVVPGDTLWDISDAYLGTPWVWPSVWTDNRDIENPHLIVPGDRIWITAHEMRRVSPEEAERLLAGKPRTHDGEGEPTGPASDSFQSLFTNDGPSNIVRVSANESTGLITKEQLDAAASIVDMVPDQVMLSQGDLVYIGLGEQNASVGDQFTIFRTQEKVFDPDTKRLLGYHVKILGWAEVQEVDEEASLASIRMSAAEMQIGDRVMPREKPVLDIEIAVSPKNVDGQISFFPASRVLMGGTDFVYLNRGELDGLQVGSPLEVYRTGWNAPEPARNTRVDVPDRVIAQLLVVRAREQSAVALVRHAETELQLGDHFRGTAE